MFFKKKEIPDIESLLERLGYLENFLKNLSQSSNLRYNIISEIDKIKSILKLFR